MQTKVPIIFFVYFSYQNILSQSTFTYSPHMKAIKKGREEHLSQNKINLNIKATTKIERTLFLSQQVAIYVDHRATNIFKMNTK